MTLRVCLIPMICIVAICGTIRGEESPFADHNDIKSPPMSGSGADPAPVVLTLQDAVLMALEGNHDIRVSSYTPPQAKEEIRIAEADYDPVLFAEGGLSGTNRRDTRLSETASSSYEETVKRSMQENYKSGIRQKLLTGAALELFEETGETETEGIYDKVMGTASPGVSITQPLLNGAGNRKTKTAIRVARLRTKASGEEFRKAVIDAVAQTTTAYWKLYLAQEQVQISQRSLDAAQTVLNRERTRCEQGLSKPLDVDRALTAVETRKAELFRMQNRLRVATDQLKLQLNSPTFPLRTVQLVHAEDKPQTEPKVVSEKEAFETASRFHPEICASRDAVLAALAEQKLAKHELLPKLDASFKYTLPGDGDDMNDAIRDSSPDYRDTWGAGIKLEYPLGNRAAEARLKQKKLAHAQSEADLARISDRVINEVLVALHALFLAAEEIPSAEQARDAALRAVEGENVRFDLGQTDNDSLLRAQDLLGNTENALSESIINYNIALSDLAKAQGSLLEDLGIGIDIRETARAFPLK